MRQAQHIENCSRLLSFRANLRESLSAIEFQASSSPGTQHNQAWPDKQLEEVIAPTVLRSLLGRPDYEDLTLVVGGKLGIRDTAGSDTGAGLGWLLEEFRGI